MTPRAVRRRLTFKQRREQIIQAVLPLFGQRGRDGVTTKELAAVGGVSEALIFRHFPTKQDLFDALLAHQTQAERTVSRHPAVRKPAPASTQELVRLVCLFVHYVILINATKNREVMRLYYRSFTEDGVFARRFLDRANVRGVKRDFVAALEAARNSGDARLLPGDSLNYFWFAHHTISAACLVRLAQPPVISYTGDDHEAVHQLVRFVLRGVGLRESALRQHATTANFARWWQES